jgi:hypothetical protein
VSLSAIFILINLLSPIYSDKHWGLCYDVETNHKYGTFNVTKMSGIWYEYLLTPGIREGLDYDCGSWLLI